MKNKPLLCHNCLKEITGEPSFINSKYGSNHPVHEACKKKNDLIADSDKQGYHLLSNAKKRNLLLHQEAV